MASLILILSLVSLSFATFYHLGEASTFLVGGSSPGWSVPDKANNTLKIWAESRRFKVGDILEFHSIKNDSVLNVTQENYEKCITDKPLNAYKVEPTAMVTLKASGAHYFISGAPGNCLKDEKLILVVQSTAHPMPPPTPKPAPGAAPPTPSKAPPIPQAPAPAPNTAVGLVTGIGFFWAIVAIVGLAWV